MSNTKLEAGQSFPQMALSTYKGETTEIGIPKISLDWKLIVVYRGKHCPICASYLANLHELTSSFNDVGVDVIAISADPIEKVKQQFADYNPSFAVGYDMSIEQMQTLGLYISNPRSPQETDRAFAEPGVFIVNDKNNLQIIDISNAPFARPELASLINGITFIRDPEKNYPIRGTYP
jgi:peroxiredoxin